jgi:hypothetical protein
VARWLAADGNAEALRVLIEWNLDGSFPRIDAERRLRALLAALTEGGA